MNESNQEQLMTIYNRDTQDIHEEVSHLRQIIKVLKKNLYIRELQYAQYKITEAPIHILNDIDNINRELEKRWGH